jgi:hypothetical protein
VAYQVLVTATSESASCPIIAHLGMYSRRHGMVTRGDSLTCEMFRFTLRIPVYPE